VPAEPRSSLAGDEAAWLGPLFIQLSERRLMPPAALLTRHGLIPGAHILRLLGRQTGAADTKLADVPGWLVARRVVDGRAPRATWIDALSTRASQDILAIVGDLATFAIPEPWPTVRLPYTPVPVTEAYVRYFALVRAAYALIPIDVLAMTLDAPANAHQITALASMVDRGFVIGEDRGSQLAALLVFFDLHDVDGMRTVLRSLPEPRRTALLSGIVPALKPDLIYRTTQLQGLWWFADLLSDELLPRLVQHLVTKIAPYSLARPGTSNEEATRDSLRRATSAGFRVLGPRVTPLLRDALAMEKPRSPMRSVLELAIEAAEGKALDPGDEQRMRPARRPTKKR
ncbi:MAG: hypothetical protein H0T79_05585, partial [Deltaproteobacteria bacterium]|nr:hypothetical protein [Deltaproteobacteria bacterium]